jgi:hypothetical protein
MTRGRKRFVDKHILSILEEYRGRGFRFGQIFKTLYKRGTPHNQCDIWKNLDFLIEKEKITKQHHYTKNYYFIPLQRPDGSKYFIINEGIEDEEIKVE